MQLKTPYVLAVDESPSKNLLKQIAASTEKLDGTLVPFTADKVQGWLFRPGVGAETILVVPPKTKVAKVPNNHARVIAAHIADAAAAFVDLTDGTWLRHPQLGDGGARNEAQEHQKVLDSWNGVDARRKLTTCARRKLTRATAGGQAAGKP
jgi:hypothetical protein